MIELLTEILLVSMIADFSVIRWKEEVFASDVHELTIS